MALPMNERWIASGVCVGHRGRKHVASRLIARVADECRPVHLRGGAMWDRGDIEHVIAAPRALRLDRLICGHVLDQKMVPTAPAREPIGPERPGLPRL